MNSYRSNHHIRKIKRSRNLLIGTVIIGLLSGACIVGTGKSYATIQSKSKSSYHNTYFVMGNRSVVMAVVVGLNISIALGAPFVIKLYSDRVQHTK